MSQHYYQNGGQNGGAGQFPGGQAQGPYQPQGGYPAQGMGPGVGPMPYQGQMMPPYAYPPSAQPPTRSFFTMPNDRFLKGMLIGAAATYLLTNEQVQRTAIKGLVKAWSLVQGGVEEVKERFGDAAAEIQHARSKDS